MTNLQFGRKALIHLNMEMNDTEEVIYDTIEYYLKDYKEIIERYRKQDIVRKMLFIVPIAVAIVVIDFYKTFQSYHKDVRKERED